MSILDILDLESPRQLVPKERTRERERPHIEVVPETDSQPSVPSRAPFVLLVLAILGVGLIGLLMLNTSLQQGSFLIHDLEAKTAKLDEREAVLEQKVATLQAPESLADRAKALGMVPNERPGFLRPGSGKVTGDPKPAEPPPPPVVQQKPDQRSGEGQNAGANQGQNEGQNENQSQNRSGQSAQSEHQGGGAERDPEAGRADD